MRRVYYLYAMRIASHTVTLQLALFCFALFIFAKMVHVRSVIDNMLSVQLGSVPQFIANALLRGEVLTLMAMGVMAFTVASLFIYLKKHTLSPMQMA